MPTSSSISTTVRAADVQQLHLDVERYLAAVELFRHEGCEPLWAAEASSGRTRET